MGTAKLLAPLNPISQNPIQKMHKITIQEIVSASVGKCTWTVVPI